MTLDDIGLYSTERGHPKSQRPLHSQARCVCSLIRRFLPRYKNDQAWKINVYLQRKPVTLGVRAHRGVASVYLTRDISKFFALGDDDKKQFVFDSLLEGVTLVSDHYRWPTEQILEAFAEARSMQLRNEWRFQPKWSPTRKLRAFVDCLHEIEEFNAWLCIEDREGKLVAKQHLLTEAPDEFCYSPLLGKVRWTSHDTVSLSDRRDNPVGTALILDN